MRTDPTSEKACDSGSTLTEMLVAGALGLVALSLLASNVLPALSTLGRAGEPDAVASALHLAADEAARLVASARDFGIGSAVVAHADGIVLRIPSEQDSQLHLLALVDGALILGGFDAEADALSGSARRLVDGLEVGSSLALVGHSSAESSPPVAVRIVLEREERVARRLVRIRRAA